MTMVNNVEEERDHRPHMMMLILPFMDTYYYGHILSYSISEDGKGEHKKILANRRNKYIYIFKIEKYKKTFFGIGFLSAHHTILQIIVNSFPSIFYNIFTSQQKHSTFSYFLRSKYFMWRHEKTDVSYCYCIKNVHSEHGSDKNKVVMCVCLCNMCSSLVHFNALYLHDGECQCYFFYSPKIKISLKKFFVKKVKKF